MPSLQAERLMTHMRVLCKQIGPRPPTSAQERRAAEYVEQILGELGLADVREQFFDSRDSFGWITVPALAAGALAVPIAGRGGRWGKLLGGALLLGGARVIRRFLTNRPVFFDPLVPQKTSQNVIARIPPAGRIRRRVFLVGHLDSNKQRFMAPPPRPAWMKPFNSLTWLSSFVCGLAFLKDALADRRGLAKWQRLIGASVVGALLSLLFDETQPHIEGANDNATAVSILLGLAEALQAQPLQQTEVTLLFTGCEEVGCVGMERYLQALAPPKQDTYWIDLEMVGTGDLCYVTRHGLSYFTEYAPHPEMVELASRVAHQHPELGVTGKDMLILEEVANLRHRDYRAICLAGYDEAGFLPNWHRLSDTLENIEPDTLERAARFTWALIQEIDALKECSR